MKKEKTYFVKREDNYTEILMGGLIKHLSDKGLSLGENSKVIIKDGILEELTGVVRKVSLGDKQKVDKAKLSIDKLIKEHEMDLYNPRTLNIISLSDDEASKSYMCRKQTKAEDYCVPCDIHYPKNVEDLHLLLDRISKNKGNRVIIQKPYDEEKWGTTKELLSRVPSYMDVDGFNFSMLDLQYIKTFEDALLHPTFSPTAKGVLAIMKSCKEDFKGLNVSVIGKGLTSGLPIALILEQLGCTVFWINSKTSKEVKEESLKKSDFIISCTGVPNLIDRPIESDKDIHYINVGMSKDENGKLAADINYDKVIIGENTVFCNKLFNTTGTLTTMCLILNTLL